MNVDKDIIEKTALNQVNLSSVRRKDLFRIINEAIANKCDMLVLPELSVPYQWIDLLAAECKKNQIAIIAGLTKYPTLKPFAKLQEGNTAFQNELDDKAIAAYTEVINDLEAKQCDEDELSYLKTSYQYMGFIYTYDKQDFDTAKPYWDKLLKLDPQNKLANDAYEKAGLKPGE